MTDTVISIEQFITGNRISMTAERVDRNPYMADSDSMDNWKVVLTRRRSYGGGDRSGQIIAKMTTYFSMGMGHHGKEPKAADVLDCLASDSASVDQQEFEGWANDLGYDSDSRQAEKIYKACEHGAARLKRFLGEDLYQTLLYGTERQ